MPNSPDKSKKYIARAATLGVEVIFYIVLGYWAGKYLAEKTGVAFMAVGGMLTGLVLSIVSVAFFIKKYLEDTT
ncbi:hypothetical protein [Marinicrinis lubricantis]|uniref:AtpZ/AtpI family protein n=1 Tax=Marinicrinis lubricantis TaxID=2086470 RepID=A0ABW1IKI8_9BACL